MRSTMANGLDVARVRGLYLTVGTGPACLDGPLSTLQPESVVRAIVATLALVTDPAGRHVRTARSAPRRCCTRPAPPSPIWSAAVPIRSSSGRRWARCTSQFSEFLARDWQLGDQIVLSRLDSDAVATPWLRAARALGSVGALGRGRPRDRRAADLAVRAPDRPAYPAGDRRAGQSGHRHDPGRARASPTSPTRSARWCWSPPGAAAPHLPLDMAALGADLISVAAPSFGGPTLAALIARPGLLLEIDGGSAPAGAAALRVRPAAGRAARRRHRRDRSPRRHGRARDRARGATGSRPRSPRPATTPRRSGSTSPQASPSCRT